MDEKILVGEIVAAQGIRGEVRIRVFTENLDDIFHFKQLFDEKGNKWSLKKKAEVRGMVIAQIENVKTRNDAEAIIKTKFYVTRSELPDLDEEYYHVDLIGLKVLKESGEEIGEVIALHNFGAGDIIEYKILDSKKTEMHPFDKDFYLEINLNEGYIIVRI